MDAELELLASVELRLASAATNDALAKTLKQLLCPLLRKLDSEHAQSRQKVLALVTHITRRVKAFVASPSIRHSKQLLPLSELALLASTTANDMILSLSLMLLDLAFKESKESKDYSNDNDYDDDDISLACSLATSFSKRIPAHQNLIFHIITPIFAFYKPSRTFKLPTAATSNDTTNKNSTLLTLPENDLSALMHRFIHLILYTPPPSTLTSADLATYTAPSCSISETLFATNDWKAKWARNLNELVQVKTGIIKFIQNETIFPQKTHLELHYTILLLASTDTSHLVLSAADDGLKRMTKPSFDSPILIALLYKLYLGDGERKPGSASVKVKVLGVFGRSVAAANAFPEMLKVSFDALFGEGTTGKLRNAGIAFVQWIARMADDTKIKPIAPILLSGLLKLIQDAPIQEADKDAESLRGFAYDAVGLLSKRAPEQFTNDISILKLFFKAVSTETRNVRVSVQDALSTMIDAYRNIITESPEKNAEIEEILLSNIDKSEHHARYSALKYANTLYPFATPFPRYLNLVASSDQILPIRELSRTGLKFPAPSPTRTLPPLSTLAKYLTAKSRLTRTSARRTAGVKYVGMFTAESFSHAVQFLWKLLIAHADAESVVDDDEVGDVEGGGLKVFGLETRARVRAYLARGLDENVGIDAVLEFVERGLRSEEADAVLQSTASACLVEIVALSPKNVVEIFREKEDWIKTFLSSLKAETRLSMSRVLGIVSTSDLEGSGRVDQLKKLFSELCVLARDMSKQTSFELRHGSILALGFLLGRLRHRHPTAWSTYMATPKTAPQILAIIAEELESTSPVFVHGACLALAEVGRYGELPVIEGDENEMDVDGKGGAVVVASMEKWTRIRILGKLKELGKATKETKIQEGAITTLGQIALGTPQVADSVLDFFYTLPQILSKHVEVNFTVGDAISAITGGFDATCMQEHLDISDVVFPPPNTSNDALLISRPNPELLGKVLERLFYEIRPGGVPVVKKSVCVWLLSIVKFCGAIKAVKDNLSKIHAAFSNLISDRDEFTQEVASKGIGLVYELGDVSIKATLVESLVSTFTEGRKIAPQSVTADTTLFQEGSLGQAPDGSNLTTYQSILSLASDLNQPDLVYKFMSLASHNAIWNSRRGATMGFGSIAAIAERELAPYLTQIVPKLYRFQFDPNVKVAESMKSIWTSLVKDPQAAINENYDVIMRDLLKGLGDRMWRTRESSCLALSDLLHGRQLVQLKPYLREVWEMCFRALDDIKESVRVAAFLTCKTLTNVTVRYCDPSVVSLKEGQEIMDIVIPFFLTKGLISKADDVAKFSLATVLKIIKKGGILLKPHLPELIATLLESLSSLEPQALSYLSFHTDKYNITQEQLDSSRLSAAKSSPMMEAIDSCVENLDSDVMESLTPKLLHIIRKGVGLPTKAGSARFVVTLAMRVPSDLRPHADAILKALSGAVTDRSPAVRKSFATAIGHIAKLCTLPALQRLVAHLQTLYTDSEEEESRSVAGITMLEVSRYSSDAFQGLNAEILPLAYLGRRDSSEVIKTSWREVWEENTAGASGAVKLYLDELINLSSRLLSTTPSWNIKKQVGLALGDIAVAIGDGITGKMSSILPMLIEALSGRTWDGKESVLQALVTVSIEGKQYFETNPDALENVTKVVIREAKKNNKPYKRIALECLGKYVEALKIDRFEELEDYLVEMANNEGDDDDDVDDIRTKPMNLAIKANSYKALGLCWPLVKETQAKFINEVLVVLVKGLEGNIWNTRIAILESIENIFAKTDFNTQNIVTEKTILIVSHAVGLCLTDGKYTAVREQSLKTLKQIIDKLKDTEFLTEKARESLLSEIDEAVAKEMITSISDPLKEIRKIISGMNVD